MLLGRLSWQKFATVPTAGKDNASMWCSMSPLLSMGRPNRGEDFPGQSGSYCVAFGKKKKRGHRRFVCQVPSMRSVGEADPTLVSGRRHPRLASLRMIPDERGLTMERAIETCELGPEPHAQLLLSNRGEEYRLRR